jgi:restriction system protein
MLWTICKGIKRGDVVICPDGQGSYYVGEVISDYQFQSNTNLPHRRMVKWLPAIIERASMSQELKNSTGSTGTSANISQYAAEVEKLIGNVRPPTIVSNDSTVEDPSVFALEKHLEDFLVLNWKQTELGKEYDIYEEDGELVGQQYPSDTGPIDILAISKDKKTLLVVELKKGRVSDNVIGQIQRYMGYVKDELAESNQKVRGILIALEDDIRLRRALSVTVNIDFYRYQVNFKLFKN